MSGLFCKTSELIVIVLIIFFISPSMSLGQNDDLFKTIWNGIQVSQQKYYSAWGKIVETRTSKLFREPLKFTGEFYAMNPNKFCIEYHDPPVLKIIFNAGFVTIIFKREEPLVERFDAAKNVERTKNYFSDKDSYEKLSKDFIVAATEESTFYEIKMVPEKDRFRKKINYVSIRFDKLTFLPRRLVIDGTNGVNSVFDIDIIEINKQIDDSIFEYNQH